MNRETEPAPQRHRLTRTDYHRMVEVGILAQDARVELIDGEIIDMAPIGPEHSGHVSRLSQLLVQAVGDSAFVWPQNGIVLSDWTEPQPDLAVLKPRTDFYTRANPDPADILLLIEVSASSLRYDTTRKGPLYARHGVPDYWVLDLAGRELTCYAAPGAEEYGRSDIHALDHTLALPGLPGCTIDLSLLPG